MADEWPTNVVAFDIFLFILLFEDAPTITSSRRQEQLHQALEVAYDFTSP